MALSFHNKQTTNHKKPVHFITIILLLCWPISFSVDNLKCINFSLCRKFAFSSPREIGAEPDSLACVLGRISNWKPIKRFIFHNRVIAILCARVLCVFVRNWIAYTCDKEAQNKQLQNLKNVPFERRAQCILYRHSIVVVVGEACLKSKSLHFLLLIFRFGRFSAYRI